MTVSGPNLAGSLAGLLFLAAELPPGCPVAGEPFALCNRGEQ
jgi:hypothetical protein